MHVYEQVDPLHDAAEAWVRVHLSPQALQLVVVLSVVQVPLQSTAGAWQLHAPLVQSGLGCEHGAHAAPAVPHEVGDWDA